MYCGNRTNSYSESRLPSSDANLLQVPTLHSAVVCCIARSCVLYRGPGSSPALLSARLSGCSPHGWDGSARCMDPPEPGSQNEGCACAKPQARQVLLPATALPLRRAKGTWLEVKALKPYLCAQIHTLKSLTEPPGCLQFSLTGVWLLRLQWSGSRGALSDPGITRSSSGGGGSPEESSGTRYFALPGSLAWQIPAPSPRRAAGTAPRPKSRLLGTSADKSPAL